jgi:Ca2+-binding EF-hand superfamily protein
MIFAALLSAAHISAMPPAASANPVGFLERSFATMDRNSDGYIDFAEAPNATYQRTRIRAGHPIVVLDQEAGPAVWLRGMDADKDGRVSKTEFISTILPQIVGK